MLINEKLLQDLFQCFVMKVAIILAASIELLTKKV